MPPTVGKKLPVAPYDEAVFLETSASSSGARVRIRAHLKAGSNRVPPHLHPKQDEHLEVVSGRLTYRVANQPAKTLGPGESVALPKGVVHEHYNADDTELVVIQTVTPGLDFDYFLESAYGVLTEAGATGWRILVQGTVWITRLESAPYIATLPVSVLRPLAYLIAPVARLFGYRAVYHRFSGEEW